MRTQINIRRNIQRIYTSNTCPKGIHGNTSTLISGVTNDDGDIGHNSKITFTTNTSNTSNTHYISVGTYNNNYTLIVPTSDNYLYDANGNMTPNNNLGSINTITNSQGNIVERMAYTAFGQRRQGDWRANDPLLPIIPTLTNRGFTGHEHIDEMGFIHMNGRVYDPSIGRFLSADPNIQAPYNAQSYNRYSYVLNNPLKYTDPSGFFLRKMFELSDKISKRFSPIGYAIQRSIEKAMMKNSTLRAIGMIAASAFGGPAGAAAFSARMAYLSGGNDGDIFKAATVSFASASAAEYIGHGTDGGSTNKAIAHDLVQGAISQISGGNFQDGFVGGFIGSVAGSSMSTGGDWSDIAGRTAIAATAGGIAAELGGGKFSNGARSAAFVHLFNHEWKLIGTATPGNPKMLNGRRYFKLEPHNTNLSITDGFYYTARGYQIDNYGEIIPSVASPGWGKHTSSYNVIINVGKPSQYGNQLNINIKTNFQPSGRVSSPNGWYINVYTSDKL